MGPGSLCQSPGLWQVPSSSPGGTTATSPMFHCHCREPGTEGQRCHSTVTVAAREFLRRNPNIGSPPLHLLPWSRALGWCPWADLSAWAHGKGAKELWLLVPSPYPAHALGQALCGARGCRGQGSPPPQGHPSEGQTDTPLSPGRRVLRLRSAPLGVCPGNGGAPGGEALASSRLSQRNCVAGRPGAGHRIPPLPTLPPCSPRGQGPFPTRWMLFCTLATRGRAAPCRNRAWAAQSRRKGYQVEPQPVFGGLPTTGPSSPG